jgi:hypothetical protein
MIVLIVAALVFVAVRLVITAIAAVLAVRMSLHAGPRVGVHGQGPQDAPRFGPWDPLSGPQDAPRPQDAKTDPAVPCLQDSPVLAPPVPAPQLAPARRWLSLLDSVREAGSATLGAPGAKRPAAVRTTSLDGVHRPTTGPAYLGGRDDGAYLRGWDDGVDWILDGNPERAPSWSSAAYMTGWNDAIRAMAKARCA